MDLLLGLDKGLAHFESDVLGLLPVAGTQHEARQNVELLKHGRHIIGGLLAGWHGSRSSEVEAFSLNTLGRRRGTIRAEGVVSGGWHA